MNRKAKLKNFCKIAAKSLDAETSLKEGDTDANTDGEVSLFQEFLELYGYKLKRHGVDGYYGPETKGAVLLFQKNNNLPETGVADKVTKNLIFKGNPKENIQPTRADSLQKLLIETDKYNLDSNAEGQTQEEAYIISNKKVSKEKLYKDLFSVIKNRNLCIAIVANAISESNLRVDAAGDCGDYAEKRSDRSLIVKDKGFCCSYGLWQYNICTPTSMGTQFLEANGNPQTNKEKLELLTDYAAQVGYMINTLQSRYGSVILEKNTLDWWVAWFVKNIEKPRNIGSAIAKRTEIAKSLAKQLY